MLALLALGASTFIASAQDAGGPPPGDRPPRQGQGQGPGGGQGMNGRRPRCRPWYEALDANHERRDRLPLKSPNASAALKKLDKNGDGKITQDEMRPQRPPGGDGQGRVRPAVLAETARPQHPPSDN